MRTEIDWDVAKQDMLEWIRQIVALGVRRPGAPSDQATEEWLLERFREFSLKDIRTEPVPVNHWAPSQTELCIPNAGQTVSCFPIPYTAWTEEHPAEVPLAYVGAGTEAEFVSQDVGGKLVVAEMQFGDLSATALRNGAHFVYDPNQTIPDGRLHTANWLIANFRAYYRAYQLGAVGFVGILRDNPIDGAAHFVPYDGYLKPLPGVWVGRESRDFLVEQARQNAVAKFISRGTSSRVESRNILGVVPGTGHETMIVSCHHDAPFASAVEDGSGLSVLLWLARYFAAAPKRTNRNILFLASSGHFHGGVGNREFVKRHRDGLLRHTVAALGVEHIAEEVESDGQGGYRLTGMPEVRALFVDQNPTLLRMLESAVQTWDLDRAMAVQPYLFGPEPPCDTAPFFTAGVPAICHITGPLYLFDPQDTIDKVRADDLPRVAGMFADLIRAIDDVPASELENGLARRRDDPPADPPPWFLPPAAFFGMDQR